MGFKLGDVIVDRIQYGIAENSDGDLLYVLSQLADGTIEITAESKDATDAQGTLVRRFWQGKTGTFSANNAMLNMNIINSAAGSTAVTGTTTNVIWMPKFVTVEAGKTVSLPGYDAASSEVKVAALARNNAMGDEYQLASSGGATATNFVISSEGVLTPPTAAGEERYIVKYLRKCTSGAVIKNSANKFPNTVKLTLQVLAVDPCKADKLRGAYIEMPSFQVSPETSISLTTDGQLEYKGDLQVNYCSADKELFSFYWADDDEEEQ